MADLTQEEIIMQSVALIVRRIDQVRSWDPTPETRALASVLLLAESMVRNGPTGWGPASAIVLRVADNLGIDLPQELDWPLRGRIR